MLLGARIAERAVVRAGSRLTVTFGFILLAGGLVLGTMGSAADGYGRTAVWEVVAGLGIGFTLPPLMALAMGELTEGREGSGSAMIQALRQVGGTIGVAILGTVLNAGYRGRIDVAGLSAEDVGIARGTASAAVTLAGRLGSPGLADSARAAFVHAVAGTLWTGGGIAAGGILLAWLFLPRRDVRRGAEPPQSEHGVVRI
jgi:hypothetical protein